MCGIAAIFDLNGFDPINVEVISAMCNVIVYRGPNDGGAIAGDGYGMGARRLSIVDLSSNGHMPFLSDDGRYYIIHNGEVYNFIEIRKRLIAEGLNFHSGTDTEVILKAWLTYGPGCLNMFNGMFAFAIYDIVEKKIFIARDRLGIKPLFYAIHNNKLFLASEMKSFWAAGIPKLFNNDKFGELFSFRYLAGEDTIYKNIKKLLPGYYIKSEAGVIDFVQWWNLSDYALNEDVRPEGDISVWYRKIFDDSVKLRQISDVPVGVLLSGGLDSSSVAASMAINSTSKISSFTMRFSESRYDEGDLAKLVAEKYHLDFNELYLASDKIYQQMIGIIKDNDEPVFHSSDIFVKEISTLAKSKVTVLLSGEGGDETLGGYVRYKPLRHTTILKLGFFFRTALKLLKVRNKRLDKFIRMLSLKTTDNFILYNSAEIIPQDLKAIGLKNPGDLSYRRSVVNEAKISYPDDPMRQVMHYDMKVFLCSLLDRNDLMTMRSSIECRVPFLDYRLVEGLASIPSDKMFISRESKSLLRKSLGERLPLDLLNGRKWGFAVPWIKYYREIPEFRNYLKSISGHKLVVMNFNEPEIIEKTVTSFLSGADLKFPVINQLLNICLWYDLNFDSHENVRR